MKRVEWIDVAKGLAIILIVMLHARDYALSLIPPSPAYPVRWVSIDPLLSYIRLPLFFLVSGMLASGAFPRVERMPVIMDGAPCRSSWPICSGRCP